MEDKAKQFTIYTDGHLSKEAGSVSSAFAIITADKFVADGYERLKSKRVSIQVTEMYAVHLALTKMIELYDMDDTYSIKFFIDNADVVRHLLFKCGITSTLNYNPVFNDKAINEPKWRTMLEEKLKTNPDADKEMSGWTRNKLATLAFSDIDNLLQKGVKFDFIWMGSHKGEINVNSFVDRLARIAANTE